jgi:hypothetical protein
MPSYAVAALKRKFGEKYEMYAVALRKKVHVMQLQQNPITNLQMEMGSSYVWFYNSLSYLRSLVNPLIHSEDLGVERSKPWIGCQLIHCCWEGILILDTFRVRV